MRGALRDATGAVHERLHQAPPFAALANQQLDVGAYTELLRRIALFHVTVSRDLESGRARTRLLAQDLEALGARVPRPVAWSPPTSASARLGLAYVVEGSSLGGKLIYRQLDYLFGRSAEGRRFFRGSPSDGGRWQALCRNLEAEGRAAGTVDEMIGSARAAFALFEQLVVSGGGHG